MLEQWVVELGRELGVDPADVDVTRILDLARDAAHAIERPAAPVTTFVAGYAAGRRGGGPEAVAAAIREALAAVAAHDAATDPGRDAGVDPGADVPSGGPAPAG